MRNESDSIERIQTCFVVDNPEAGEVSRIFRLAREYGALAVEMLPYETISDVLETSQLYGQTANQLNDYYQKRLNESKPKDGRVVMNLDERDWTKKAKIEMQLGHPIVRIAFNANNDDLVEFESAMWAMRKSRKTT